MSGARRTEPTAWLVAPRDRCATLLDYVPASHTDIAARWRAAGLLPAAPADNEPEAPRLVVLRRGQGGAAS